MTRETNGSPTSALTALAVGCLLAGSAVAGAQTPVSGPPEEAPVATDESSASEAVQSADEAAATEAPPSAADENAEPPLADDQPADDVGVLAPEEELRTLPELAGDATETEEEHPESSESERQPALRWRASWRPVSWPALLSTGVLLGGRVALKHFLSPPGESRFSNANRFDLFMRQIALDGDAARGADLASDFTRYSAMLWPIADAVMVAAADRNLRVATQLMLMNIQSMAITGFLVRTTKITTGRLRPHESDCDPTVEECVTVGSSFFSGHTATSFTGAGLVCVQHRHLDLYGGGWGDKAACGMAMTAAVGTGLLRMLADRHWVTDVMVGATVGLLSGWLVPRLLYFRSGADEDFIHRRMRRGVVMPMASHESAGLSYARVF